MNRDHMLGWPPSLLALDPEPKPVQRTRTYRRTPPHEQQVRRNLDAALTARLEPPPPPGSVEVVDHSGPPGVTPTLDAPVDEWRYYIHEGDKRVGTVHRVRGSVAEYACPHNRRWKKSPWEMHCVATFAPCERPAWDPDLPPAQNAPIDTGYAVNPDIRVREAYRLRANAVWQA